MRDKNKFLKFIYIRKYGYYCYLNKEKDVKQRSGNGGKLHPIG